MKFDRKGLMLVLSSPSGAGKTSLCKKIVSSDKNIILSVSSTTRPKRKSEIEGKDYFFSNEKEFIKQKEKNVFIETAKVFGFHYGTPKKFVENNLNEGKDILFDIDWQGTQKLSDYSISDLVSIFILPPSTNELKKRLKRRAEDSDEIVENRMSKARSEISHWVEYDYVLINEDINKCLEKILVIIEAERSKRSRQKYIFDFVEKLI
ncbi:MAG: guanylate kinase [Rickettsiales bacterium]|nr:guanylate kinase [Rickettsiales bacterium]OUW70991.1 MAG: guanylate kinase [Rickettsiales bacterium TMED211]